MQKLVCLVLISIALTVRGQNKQLLYDFQSIPQHSLLNPGSEIAQEYFLGVPLLSQFSLDIGSTGFSLYDLFAVDGTSINDKLRGVVEGWGKREIVHTQQQLEILTGGYALPNNRFITAGIYQESNYFVKLPHDVIDLLYYGNQELDRAYSIEETRAFTEFLNVFHFGYTAAIADDLIAGVRFKLYSSVFHGSLKNTRGTLTTREGTSNLLVHQLENVDIALNSSGIPDDEEGELSPSDVMSRMLLGGNLGLGFDLGFTKYLSKQLKLTGSVLDLGVVHYSKEVRNFSVSGAYQYEGAELTFEENPELYWNFYRQEFKEAFNESENDNAYLKLRPVKLNAGVHYSFGVKRDATCNYLLASEQYLNKLSAQFFAVFGEVNTRIAGTLAYEHWFGKGFQAKVSYTADSFSFANIGLGAAAQIGPVQFYMLANNMLHMANLYDARVFSLQFGLNFNFYDLN